MTAAVIPVTCVVGPDHTSPTGCCLGMCWVSAAALTMHVYIYIFGCAGSLPLRSGLLEVLLFTAVCGLLTAVASPVLEHGL